MGREGGGEGVRVELTVAQLSEPTLSTPIIIYDDCEG